ncbi:hypothetical protein CVT26_005015 [Gymnopilus dilepis]|uniref:Uncharacterized protein n=1 Tax=Gymnopilus dilepis TaxID=231916 RepID=A0A409W8B0_9AGAR|nr:hypothetical protein CVT26_005015 [Gymnopilus dilepis]
MSMSFTIASSLPGGIAGSIAKNRAQQIIALRAVNLKFLADIHTPCFRAHLHRFPSDNLGEKQEENYSEGQTIFAAQEPQLKQCGGPRMRRE